MLRRRQEVANQAEAGRANPAAAAAAAATAGVVLASSSSQRHRVTDVVALPGRGGSSASKHSAMSELCWGAGSLGSWGARRGQARTGTGGGAHRLSAIIRYPYHLFLARGGGGEGREQLGIGNQRGPSGWQAPETTNGRDLQYGVPTVGTQCLHSKLARIAYMGNKVVPLPRSSCPSPAMLCGRHAHGWHAHAVPTVRCKTGDSSAWPRRVKCHAILASRGHDRWIHCTI